MKLLTLLKQNKWLIFCWILFFLTRALVLKFPPPFYSDVSHDYERYANMWWYGLTPYLEHYYEYPPATIPLLLAPLWLDLKGLGFYYLNYRLIIFILEIAIFALILKIIRKNQTPSLVKTTAIVFYCLSGLIAKNFWYEGLDLVFISAYLAGLYFIINAKTIKNHIAGWFLAVLSTAIKFMSGPMLAILWAAQRLKLKQKLITLAIGGLLVWGLPLAIFRTSLSVSLVYHFNRPVKYGSFQSFIVDSINHFTQTETRINKPPDFQLTGPVSQQAMKIFQPIFYLGVIAIALIAFIKIQKHQQKSTLFSLALNYSFIYILFIFLAGKIFSAPFHIWLVPLLAVYPFKTFKQQLLILSLALYMSLLDTANLFNLQNPVTLKLIRDSTRFIPMFILLYWFTKKTTKRL